VSSSGGLSFSIKQKGNLAVMQAIQNFFNELLISNTPLIASNSTLTPEKGTQALKDSSSYCSTASNLNKSEPFEKYQVYVASLSTSKQKEVEVNSLTISR